MSWWLIGPIVWLIIAMVVTPVSIGKPRGPLTGGTAAFIIAAQLGMIVCLMKAGGAL